MKHFLIFVAIALSASTVEAKSHYTKHYVYRHASRTRVAKAKPIMETGTPPKTVAELTPELIREWVLKK